MGAAKLATPGVDFLAILPALSLAAAAMMIVLGRSMVRTNPRVFEASVLTAFTGVFAAAVFLVTDWIRVRNDGAYTTIGGMVALDGFSVFLGLVIVGATFLALLTSVAYLRREGLAAPEYLALMLLSAAGMLIMTTANDLIVVFLALEILSIPLYVLAAFDRRRLESQEAGLKYFILGAFSSAVFLYGVALAYGATGTTNLTGIATFLAENTLLEQGTLFVGLALLLVGLGFKVAASPFHMWTPDVYQGAPTPVTSFMASATKAAGFAALLRVLFTAFQVNNVDWRPAIWALAALSLVVGSVGAILQADIKRLLAYSSISHAGYVLIAVQTDTARGLSAALFYLFTYALMVLGAFAIVTILGHRGDADHSLDGYRGLGARRPVLAGALAFFLLAQAGVPLTGGFVAKLNVFAAAVQADEYGLALVGVLLAVVAAFAYLRVVVVMYMGDDEDAPVQARRARIDVGTATVVLLTTASVLFLGVFPSALQDFARDATLLF